MHLSVSERKPLLPSQKTQFISDDHFGDDPYDYGNDEYAK